MDASEASGAPQGSEPELRFDTQPRQHPAQTTFSGNTCLSFSRVFHTWAFVPDTHEENRRFQKSQQWYFLWGGMKETSPSSASAQMIYHK